MHREKEREWRFVLSGSSSSSGSSYSVGPPRSGVGTAGLLAAAVIGLSGTAFFSSLSLGLGLAGAPAVETAGEPSA